MTVAAHSTLQIRSISLPTARRTATALTSPRPTIPFDRPSTPNQHTLSTKEPPIRRSLPRDCASAACAPTPLDLPAIYKSP
jgi:hypothetical protein